MRTYNFYQILGVSRSATDAEIRKAFHSLAHIHHPDKQGGEKESFQLINEAYRVLSDPIKREMYDLDLTESQAAKAANGSTRSTKEPEVQESPRFSLFKFILILAFYFGLFWACTKGADALGVPWLGYFVYFFIVYCKILK